MSKELPYVLPRTRLVFPHQPFHDDFLQVMGKVFQWSRLFGVAGPDRRFWRLWGILVLFMLVMIQIGAIYKLVKLLAGLTLYSSGNRSITARIAGTMFYTCTFTSLLLTWKLYSCWDKISAVWVTFERKLMVMVPTDLTLKRRMVTMILFMAACSALEHIMSVMSAVEFDCPPELLLEKYVLTSHGFIFIQSDYSVWVGILVFIVSNIATILWNFQDMLIVLVSMGLTSRYLRLNQCIAKISTMDNRDTKWSQDTETLKMYMWRKIRDAYVKQAMLVRRVDESIGGLILLSSFQNFYFICLQLFLGITQGITGAVIKRIYYLVSMVWLCVRFSCVVLSAANVNVHSRKALRYLHSYSTRGYNTEVDRLQKQLSRDFVALSGMGFFYLDRTILLQMAGAVITYELVLIQFDGRG